MKALTRRYQVMPPWWFCAGCGTRERGCELAARAHAVITGHEVRHVRAAETIIRLTPAPEERP